MNPIDRAVAWLSPARGARRMRARLGIEMLQRSYDGAKTGRRTDGWITAGTSANAEIGPASARLRDRSRDLVRNNPYGARTVDVWTSHLVGTGIRPRSRTGNPALDRQVDDLFAAWAVESDADGGTDFYGLQALAVRALVQDGEALVRFRDRRASDGLTVPLQLQVLEADFLDTARDTLAPQPGSPRIALGIEFDALGRRSAYWLFREHPGEASSFSRDSVRVAAGDVAHVYRRQRPGQVRGAPWMAPSMLRLRDLDDFQEAALVKAKVEACLSLLVTRPEEDGTVIGQDARSDAAGRRIESLSPAMVQYLQPGEDVEVVNPSSTAGQFEPFTVGSLMAAAVGTGITYDQIAGDLRQANYSSLRAGKIEFRRQVEQVQWQVLVPQLCQPSWARFTRNAILAGKLPDRAYPVEWAPPAHEPIDPKKDLEADVMAVRTGRMTWAQFVSAWGYDPRRQAEEIREFNQLHDELALILDTDPRRTAKGGAAQKEPQSAETEDD